MRSDAGSRGSQWKYGLGYVPNPFASTFVRRHRVAEPDFRIHFALNCGAASCPAVAAYDAETVEANLDAATKSYLRSETLVEERTAYVPRLLLWYRGDFGGRSGIRRILREYDVVGSRRRLTDPVPRVRLVTRARCVPRRRGRPMSDDSLLGSLSVVGFLGPCCFGLGGITGGAAIAGSCDLRDGRLVGVTPAASACSPSRPRSCLGLTPGGKSGKFSRCALRRRTVAA
ncbi:MAG: DUF547 domain-containing protein [Halobacteriales archaeon]|nr:DUF547 domain-containing protein [Halobacteriales archaeon]